MRTSRQQPVDARSSAAPPGKTHRGARIVIKVVVTLLLVAAINAVLCFALVPYGSKSEVMWNDYRQQQHIDTVGMGTSLFERAFDPTVVDPLCGTESFNMSTPSQLLDESCMGLQQVMEQHDVKTVLYGLEYSNLRGKSASHPGRAYVLYRDAGDPAAYLSDSLALLANSHCYSTDDSINCLFPWIYNHVKLEPAAIANNVRMRLDGTTVHEAAFQNERDGRITAEATAITRSNSTSTNSALPCTSRATGASRFPPKGSSRCAAWPGYAGRTAPTSSSSTCR